MKDCYCYTCDKDIHHLGIAKHRAMHRDKKEDCKIIYKDGTIINHKFREVRNETIRQK